MRMGGGEIGGAGMVGAVREPPRPRLTRHTPSLFASYTWLNMVVLRLPCASEGSMVPLPLVSCARTLGGSGVPAGGIAMFFSMFSWPMKRAVPA